VHIKKTSRAYAQYARLFFCLRDFINVTSPQVLPVLAVPGAFREQVPGPELERVQVPGRLPLSWQVQPVSFPVLTDSPSK